MKVRTYDDIALVNATAYIQHPLADEISIAAGDGAMATFPYSVEIAFFRNGEWVDEILPEFASYTVASDSEYRVYGHVPLWEFASFLKAWRVQ